MFLQERFKISKKLASVDSSVYLKHALRLSPEDHLLTLTEQLIRVRDHEVCIFVFVAFTAYI